MTTVEAQTAMVRIRVDYIDRWPRVTFTELAELHGVGRQTIARAAKRERWAHHARVIYATKQDRRAAEEQTFARYQAIDIAHAILGFARDRRISPEQLAAEAREAAMGLDYLWSSVHWRARAQAVLRDAKADRPNRPEPVLRDLSGGRTVSGGKGVPGRWPWFGYGPREPWPWERRRARRRA
jgi:IS30 family transposase